MKVAECCKKLQYYTPCLDVKPGGRIDIIAPGFYVDEFHYEDTKILLDNVEFCPYCGNRLEWTD